MQRMIVALGIFLLTLISVGCSPVKLPRVSSYELTGNKLSKITDGSCSKKILAVTNPTANPGYDTSSMAYVQTPFQLAYFTRNRWVAPPQQMLLPLVVRALRAQGYYKAVVPAPRMVQVSYRLDLNLLALEQDFLLPKSRERVEIQATLLNSATHQIVASRRFERIVTAKTNTPYGGVLAANEALATLCEQIAAWCVRNSRSYS